MLGHSSTFASTPFVICITEGWFSAPGKFVQILIFSTPITSPALLDVLGCRIGMRALFLLLCQLL